MSQPFSDYIIFADESGDHGLLSIDPEFPVFALVFCIVRKDDYLQNIVPAFQQLKMDYWGHDQIIFHEHDIRKEKGPFGILRTNKELRQGFYNRLNEIIEAAPIRLITSVIDKPLLRERYDTPYNPYEIAMLFCMERTLNYLVANKQAGSKVPLLFESRGKREDDELELEFRRICDNRSNWGYRSPDFQQLKFEHQFVDKKSNSSGLQLADLVARPLALRYLRPKQSNRAMEIIEGKLLNTKTFP
ncbi:MAG: DUF3800 domain-containing protein [Gammaproteobacteria bacterium]|nr:MAG: DUF3800 domain-containing protein [Gammaproteobacteria bacterium]